MSNKKQQRLKFCFLFVVFSILLSSCQYSAEKQKNTNIPLPTSDVGLNEPVEENDHETKQDIRSIIPGYFYYRNSEKLVAVNITVPEDPKALSDDYWQYVENHHAKEISSQDDTVLYVTAFPFDHPLYNSIWFDMRSPELDMRSPEHSRIDIGYCFLNVILYNGDTLEIVFAENGHGGSDVLLRIEHAYGGYTIYSGEVHYYVG
jgi:hypothetical protein